MPWSSRWAGLALAICALGAVGAASTNCGDRVHVQVYLERTPVESSARGSIQLQMDEGRSLLRLRVRHLLPETEYLLLADGVEQTRFTTNRGGQAEQQLRYPPSPAHETLGFDPRGRRISVSDGSEDRLSAVVNGPGEPARSYVYENAGIPPSDPAEPGSVRGVYQTAVPRCRLFNVILYGVEPGTYQVRVDGTPVGEVETEAGRRASLRMVSRAHPGGFCPGPPGGSPGAPPSRGSAASLLDFEPRGAWVEVIRDGAVVFEGPMRAQVALPEEAEACPAVYIETDLNPTRWFGAGEAAMKSKDDVCEHEFHVAARNLPVANYEIWVAGSRVGTLPVRNYPGGSRGEARFDTVPDDPDELPLDFDPRGQPLEIIRPMTNPPAVYLEAAFPTE